jgi:hypothetical protein
MRDPIEFSQYVFLLALSLAHVINTANLLKIDWGTIDMHSSPDAARSKHGTMRRSHV